MLFDRVSFATATTGAGTLTAGAATSGFRTMAQASIPDGTSVTYAIEEGAAWETGTGIVGASATTLTRVLSQSSTGALLVLTGSAKCFLTPIAGFLNSLTSNLSTTGEKQIAYAGGNIVSITELDGTVTTLNYANGLLSSIVKVKGAQTVAKSLVYLSDGKTIDKTITVVTTT